MRLSFRIPSTDLMSVSGPEKPGREVSPGLCPGPAKGTARGTSLLVFAASGLNSLHRDSVAALKGRPVIAMCRWSRVAPDGLAWSLRHRRTGHGTGYTICRHGRAVLET